MLESIRRGQRWLVLLIVGGIGGVFVLWVPTGGGPGSSNTRGADSIVEIDDVVIDTTDFYIRREIQERQLRDQLGDQFDAKTARAFIDQQVLRSLVEQAVLAYSAREVGIRVTKPEIQRFLRDVYRSPDGTFDQDALVDAIESQYGTQRIFLESIERELLANKMVQLLASQARVSEAEMQELARYVSEEVRLAYVQLDTTALPEDAEPSEEELAAFRAANEEALRARYDDEIDRYTTPDRVRARHLLIEVPAGADDVAERGARETAEQARERIVGGAEFATVAAELSDDLGTREAGGALGLVSRDEMAGAIGDAAFDLEVGTLSEVVRGERGYHVVLVEEKVVGGTRSFDEVVDELAREGALLELAKARADRLASALSDEVRGGRSLEDAARERELTLVRTGSLRRRADGFVPDLGAAPELLAVAFSLDDGESSPRIFELGNRLVLIQTLERVTPDALELSAQIDGSRDGLVTQKRNQVVQTWLDAEQERLEAAGELRIDASLVIGS